MAKKKSRKSRTSNGVVGTRKGARTSLFNTTERALNQQAAWLKGKRVMLTIPNPDKTATNERTIRVEARQVWGLPPMLRRKESNASKG